VTEHVNNHIHTTYSFSPYTPTEAVKRAKESGLATAGIMDHDSVGGLEEFIAAGRTENMPITVGFEMRVSFENTPFAGRRINNPDQDSVAYLAMHGIPHKMINECENFLRPYREARNIRNRNMTEKLNTFVREAGLSIDFDRDVLPLSMHEKGGSVTERHILFALAQKIMDSVTKGEKVVDFLHKKFDITVSGKNLERLSDPFEPWYRYYLLGVLKGHMVSRFYIKAAEELPDYKDFIALAERIGAISAYAYLGDVGDSVTGDKATQKFEDAYLNDLVAFLKNAGFRALTYMPARNTKAQLERLITLCQKHDLFEICGEDINSPFQPFVCDALMQPMFGHLITAAYALIGHEQAGFGHGLFSEKITQEIPLLQERVTYFANKGRGK